MAEKTIKTCDWNGSTKDVASYQIEIQQTGTDSVGVVFERQFDLCPRAVEKIKHQICLIGTRKTCEAAAKEGTAEEKT